ncbi:calcium-binding protein [Cribrihabitans pelagius]|uniref:calcium-binding protein n=1 Tax=Cribrihabitans pelagius TaxID=1765746 RepID=UPI003B5A174A
MELLILLGLGLTAGTFALLNDDDDSGDSEDGNTDERQGSSDPEPENYESNEAATITATDAANDIIGGSQDQSIFLRGGDDLAEGRGGDDRIFGMDGEDFIVGGSGDDCLRGGADNDLLIDNAGSDTMHGDSGNDLIAATSTFDGEGLAGFYRGVADGSITDPASVNDHYSPDTDTDSNADSVFGGGGNDSVIAGEGDTVSLGSGNDMLAVGDWHQSDDDPVFVTDFDTSEDVLVYSHDGEGTMPDLFVMHLEDGTGGGQGSALLFADNALVARMPGAGGLLSVSDISIVERTPESSLLS